MPELVDLTYQEFTVDRKIVLDTPYRQKRMKKLSKSWGYKINELNPDKYDKYNKTFNANIINIITSKDKLVLECRDLVTLEFKWDDVTFGWNNIETKYSDGKIVYNTIELEAFYSSNNEVYTLFVLNIKSDEIGQLLPVLSLLNKTPVGEYHGPKQYRT